MWQQVVMCSFRASSLAVLYIVNSSIMKYFAAAAAVVVLGAAAPALAFVNVGAITAAQSR